MASRFPGTLNLSQQRFDLKYEPTIDVAPVCQWLEILESFGANRATLVRLLECDESYLLGRDNRIPTRCHNAMLHAGAEETGIPGIILLAGSRATAESLGVVGHLMKNCATLLDAGQQIARFATVLSETGRWNVSKNQRRFEICYTKAKKADFHPEIEEASLSSCIGVLRDLSAAAIIPLEVRFSHPDPGYANVYKKVFGISVQFDQPECLLSISEDDAHRAIPSHQSYTHALLESHAEALLQKLGDDDSAVSRASQLVASHLAEGRVDIEWISGQMHMSRWTLTRHLKQEGVTFNDLVRDIRSKLAQSYLHDRKMSITEIGFLLGYSEPSAFQRAFRGWYKCTPSEFRTRH
jgi:AraC-like DNA-binding protein